MTPTASRPLPPFRATRWLTKWAAHAYVLGLVVAAAALYAATDSSPLPTLLAFGPRWVLALPLALLAPLALLTRAWWLIAEVAVAGLIAAGPVTGGHLSVTGLTNLAGEAEARQGMRVVTWNTGGPRTDTATFRAFMERVKPDVMLFQEAGGIDDSRAGFPPCWTLLRTHNQGAVASRFPIRADGVLTERELVAWGAAARFAVVAPDPWGEFPLVNVHLPTPRPGIETAVGTKLRNLRELQTVLDARDHASAVARAWVGPPLGTAIVAGDFNAPPESTVFRRDWGEFGSAFRDAGLGWGQTKKTRWFGARIDHVLYGPAWRCTAAWVGPDMGSDHRPLIVDLSLAAEAP